MHFPSTIESQPDEIRENRSENPIKSKRPKIEKRDTPSLYYLRYCLQFTRLISFIIVKKIITSHNLFPQADTLKRTYRFHGFCTELEK